MNETSFFNSGFIWDVPSCTTQTALFIKCFVPITNCKHDSRSGITSPIIHPTSFVKHRIRENGSDGLRHGSTTQLSIKSLINSTHSFSFLNYLQCVRQALRLKAFNSYLTRGAHSKTVVLFTVVTM